jgi:hypothetical protein
MPNFMSRLLYISGFDMGVMAPPNYVMGIVALKNVHVWQATPCMIFLLLSTQLDKSK